ncbi:MAG: UvrD-helicase domain-containing protein [Gemmatimonadota bacterium]|nr:UvrD-helicase domain-containing protein [Gemmatimonadota bacterium]
MAVDLSHLNPEQREAAEHFERPLLVLAGAGSGKTRVLTARIVHLVEEFGVDPAGILALTFTNKAAGEMRERIRSLLTREPAGMWVGTFHAIGARILRRHAPQLGWGSNFLIYDAGDAEGLVRRIARDELHLDPKRWSPRAMLSTISAAKNELVGVQSYQEAAADLYTRQVGELYERYQRALQAANAFDFDDLLVKPVELLRAFPEVLAHYRARFRFLLVDEYQDTNRAQYAFLRMLAEEHENLFVVGDDDQSIYGWRGADIRNILDFETDFPGAKIVRLEQNYRSTRAILDAANRVIAENLRRKGKTLRTENSAGERLTLVEAADEADEAEWIVSEIRSRMADDPHGSPREFVILYRTNAQSRPLEEALIREAIPYRIIGGTRFYERREIRDAMAYLRLVANPAADESFLRVVNVPRRGLGDTTVARLADWAARERVCLLQASGRAGEVSGLRAAAVGGLEELAALVERYAALADGDTPLETLLQELVVESGLVQMYREEGPEGEERAANLDELVAGAADLRARLADGDADLLAELEEAGEEGVRMIDLFLNRAALLSEADQHDQGTEAVTLMTLHTAKGLEFPTVFIAGMEEGLFPLERAYDEPETLEEERRLFYVGITRAQRKLYLTLARRRRRGGQFMDAAPSSFLDALARESVETRKTNRLSERFAPSRPWRSPSGPTRRQRLGLEAAPTARSDDRYQVDYSDSQETPRLVKGGRVRHPRFGGGTVLELSGGGADVRVTIDFDSVGRKQVGVRYANLQAEWE